MKRFLSDAMLSKLATYLRMWLRYGLALERDIDRLEWANEEDRTLLTRNQLLAARSGQGIHISAGEPAEQLPDLREAGIEVSVPGVPTRCSRCNRPLAEGHEDVRPDYAPLPNEQPAWRCVDCGQYF